MNDEDMILEEQTEEESTVEEVQTNEEQTEQGATNSLDDILAGVNELLEQSSSYSAYLEEGEPEPEDPVIAYDNGNAVAVSDLDAIAVQAANSSVYPGTWSGSILDYFSGVMRQNPGKHVALRKESVDRNSRGMKIILSITASLSARRAWIEMFLSMGLDGRFKRRSPQGERG